MPTETPPGQCPVRVAAAQYPMEFLGHWSRFEEKLRTSIACAARKGTRLAVYPEYASMELASLFGPDVFGNLRRQLEAMQTLLQDYRALYKELAVTHSMYVLAGSFPVRLANGEYRNRAYFYAPDGTEAFQDKLHMTRFESEQWGILPGTSVSVFRTSIGGVAVAACYDVEFPLAVRRQVEAGAQVILAPSCTDREAGYQRVRIGARARAMENQVYVVQAPTVGHAEWSISVDVNTGAAGFYTPVDHGFPDDGILAEGTRDAPGWVHADLDMAALADVRLHGQVLNHQHWARHRQTERLPLEIRSL